MKQLIAACLSVLCMAGAQAWPDKPIRLVVPFPAGGGTDIIARDVSAKLTTLAKWSFIVDNKPGSGGNLGVDAVAKSPPDGYQLVIGQTSNLAINPTLYSKLPYDPIRSFTPGARVGKGSFVLVVTPAVPARTLKELIEYLKANPDKASGGTAGIGSGAHLGALAFNKATGELLCFLHNDTEMRDPGWLERLEGAVRAPASIDLAGLYGVRRLRRELGILPPGDIRDCLVALAESEPLMTDLFEYRFQGGALDGHAFGNLFIASPTADSRNALPFSRWLAS